MHARPNTRRDDESMRRFFSLAPGEPKSFTMPVVAGTPSPQCFHPPPGRSARYGSIRGRPWSPFGVLTARAGERAGWGTGGGAGTTLEIALAQFWLSLGSSAVTLEVAFHAVTADPGGALVLHGAAQSTRVDCWAPLRMETLQPVIKLTTVVTSLRPTACTVRDQPTPPPNPGVQTKCPRQVDPSCV